MPKRYELLEGRHGSRCQWRALRRRSDSFADRNRQQRSEFSESTLARPPRNPFQRPIDGASDRRFSARVLQMPAPQEGPSSGPSSVGYPRRGCGAGLADFVDRITTTVWPFSFLESVSEWLEEGTWLTRMVVGFVAGMVMATLLFADIPRVHWLRSMAQLPLFGDQGPLVLIVASIAIGVVLLPILLSHGLAMLMRMVVLLALFVFAAGICHEGYLLISSYTFLLLGR